MASKQKESIWKKHPELAEALTRFIADDNILDGNKLKELINTEAKSLGIKKEISLASINSKKAHLSKSDAGVKQRVKEERQRELLEERHAIKEAVLQGRWLSAIGIEGDIDYSSYIPKNTGPSRPYNIPVKNKKAPNIMALNAPLVGSLVETDLNKDVFHNSLRYAEKASVDGVVITGDLLYILTQKWGTQKPRKVNVVGIDPDPKIVEEAYPDVVLREKNIEDRLEAGDIVFTTVKARLELVLQELSRVFRDDNGKPVYNGPVYVVLGELEEEIGIHYANEIVRLLVRQEQDLAQNKIDMLRLEIRHEEDKKIIARLQNAITEWSLYKQVISLMSNVSDTQVREIAEQMVGYLVKNIEENVPNAVVVGRGDASLEMGEIKAFVTRGKVSTAYNGTSAGNIREKTYTHIHGNPGLNIPDVILVAGLNPYWTGLYASHFVPELAGTLDDRRTTSIIQLPTALSAEKYRQALRNFAKVSGGISKVAEVSDFESGATILKWNEHGLFTPRALLSNFLRNEEIFSADSNIERVIKGEEPRSRMIYSQKQGCEHAGARFLTQYLSPNDPSGRLVKSHFQVCFEAFIKSDAPIHMFQSDGDTLHWANYPVHKEGFPDERLSLQEYLDKMAELTNDKELSTAKRDKLRAILAHRYAISEGVMQPDGQLDFYQYLLRPVKPFLFNVMKRAEDSGLVTVGPRMSAILQGQGNHNENSFKHGHVNISEAEFVRRGILLELLEGADPKDHARIKKAVVAAVFSDVGEGRGMFGIPCNKDKEYTEDELIRLDKKDGYFYALYLMHKQGTSKTKDNMAPMIKAFRNRLTEHQYEANRYSINLGGDDHTGGWAITRTALHVKSGCQMGGNSFGRKSSFPEQNIFSAVWGVPAGGPAWGPMTVITFDQRFARKYADKPFDLDVQDLFPNPA